jgi:cystathionine gamma-synthase
VDIVCSSLTKIFSGIGNVMAGSLILNPSSPYYNALKTTMHSLVYSTNDVPILSDIDAKILEYNSRIFLTRSSRINENALLLANWFQLETNNFWIKAVYYPGLSGESLALIIIIIIYFILIVYYIGDSQVNYHKVKRRSTSEHCSGYGCLISILLHDHVPVDLFYNALPFNKGPSLGTSFTLICPYTLLAHYTELNWAERFHVSRHLIRISIGLEEISEIKKGFQYAIDIALAAKSS